MKQHDLERYMNWTDPKPDDLDIARGISWAFTAVALCSVASPVRVVKSIDDALEAIGAVH